MQTDRQTGLAEQIAQELPYLRRYARALTGNQSTGDSYAIATLEAVLADKSVLDGKLAPRTSLFRAFHHIWTSSGAPVDDAESEDMPETRAQSRMAGLTQNTREALLLHSIEGFTVTDIAAIVGVSPDEAEELVDIAHREMQNAISGRVMVIEDEPVIAMDITAIVENMGHAVTGVARTRDKAVELARRDPPDLILADIQLADKSSGIDAVNHILKEIEDIPVVFITAFPERLLTGERPEPAFLITKPYTEDQVESAVSQAMFFSSTETLNA